MKKYRVTTFEQFYKIIFIITVVVTLIILGTISRKYKGLYFVNVLENNHVIKTQKIIKQ